MALDEQKDSDRLFVVDGFEYVIDQKFIEKIQPVKIDFGDFGFLLDCNYDFGRGGGCSGCGTQRGSCGS